MNKIKDLTKFLERNFPEGLNDMKVSLEILKELLQKTNDNIAKSMSELMKEKEYNTAREHINKSEEIMEYIEKLDDIIGLVTTPDNEDLEKEKTLESIKDLNIRQEEVNKVNFHEKEVDKKKTDKGEKNNKEESTKKEVREKDTEKEKASQKDKNNVINYDEYSLNKNKVHYLDENLKYTQPCVFILGNKEVKVDSWKEMLVETCRILKDRDSNKFINFMNDEDFKGARRPYFSFERKNMSEPKIININCKKVFIETNLSINVINKLLHKLVRQYDMDLKQCKIYLKEEQPEALKTK